MFNAKEFLVKRELKQILNEAGLAIGSPTAVVPTTEPDPVRYELDKERLSASAMPMLRRFRR